jgi:uncharacterized membrane protein YfcA
LHAGQLALIALAGFAAGALNALAGGGTLVSFPALLALGLPALSANAASTIALSPGYFAAAIAQRGDLRGQGARLSGLLPLAAGGGLLGAALLLHSGTRAFASAVPVLILLACALLAAQERVRAMLLARGARATAPAAHAGPERLSPWALALVIAAAVYGGYFGAGMSVIVLAALGLALADTLPRLNALKQAVAAAANGSAAVWLAAHAGVDWGIVAVLAAGAACGGAWGGRLAGRIPAALLRRIVVLLGLVVAAVYLLRMLRAH